MKNLLTYTIATMLPFTSTLATANAYEGTFINIDGHETHLVDRGEGPTIILIHGLGADLSRWHRNFDALSENHRVVALDLLGFGLSEKPDLTYSIQLWVDQVSALMDILGIRKATLVGNSMGGLVSLRLAQRHPERIEDLVLVAPAFVFGLPEEIEPKALAKNANPQTLSEMKSYLGRIYHETPTREDEIRRELVRKKDINDVHTINSIVNELDLGNGTFTRESIQMVTARTLIVQGTSDGVVPAIASEKLVELMPNADLELISSVGHWPQLEFDSFNQLLLSWIRR